MRWSIWRAATAAAALWGGAAAAPVSAAGADAATPVRPQPAPIVVHGGLRPAAPDLFGTATLPIRGERFLDDWERARRDATHMPQMAALIAPARGFSRDRQIAYVQAAVHQHIRWISDATQWSRHDYWASAAETLARRAGDMEDRAIVKMQALRALGVPSRDLYMTMGRDTVGGPITVLLVRSGGRVWLLDDTGGQPIPTTLRKEFEPMITLGYGASWIHGRRVARSGPAISAAARN